MTRARNQRTREERQTLTLCQSSIRLRYQPYGPRYDARSLPFLSYLLYYSIAHLLTCSLAYLLTHLSIYLFAYLWTITFIPFFEISFRLLHIKTQQLQAYYTLILTLSSGIQQALCETFWAACSDGAVRVWDQGGKPMRLLKVTHTHYERWTIQLDFSVQLVCIHLRDCWRHGWECILLVCFHGHPSIAKLQPLVSDLSYCHMTTWHCTKAYWNFISWQCILIGVSHHPPTFSFLPILTFFIFSTLPFSAVDHTYGPSILLIIILIMHYRVTKTSYRLLKA